MFRHLSIRPYFGFAVMAVAVGVGAVVVAQSTPPAPQPDPAAQPPAAAEPIPAQPLPAPAATPANSDQNVQVMTRGLVHEAFGEPLQYDAAHPLVAQKCPPDPIDEVPPDVKPAGDNVVWISGYWGWDDDQRDFVWVSGIWRDVPPGQAWVPGYWAQTDNRGCQWVPGFWNSATEQQVSYYPQPPANPTEGPSTPAPSDDDFWVPGNWLYTNSHYAWQPGYWSQTQPDWLWSPSHYMWTPYGYVFVAGYWDHPLARRGVLFAPVNFTTAVYAQPNYYYTPSVAIDAGLLTTNLFVRPDYCHYYFGDYYGQTYINQGFQPWFAVRGRGGDVGYDPLFTYYRWNNARRDPGWFNRLQQRYVYLNDHPDARPVRIFADEERIARSERGQFNAFSSISQRDTVLAAPYREFVNRNAALSSIGEFQGTRNLRFEQLDRQQLDRTRQNAKVIRDFGEQRGRIARGAERPTSFSTSPLANVFGNGRATEARPQERVAESPTGGRPTRTETLKPVIGPNNGIPADMPNRPKGPILNEGSNPGRERPFGSPNLGGPRSSEINKQLPASGAAIGGNVPRALLGNGSLSEPRFPHPPNESTGPQHPSVEPNRTVPPRVTEPRTPEPRITQPRVTEPRTTTPQVRTPEPRAVEPRVTEPRNVEPRVTEPRVTEPRASQRPAEPRATEPRVAERPNFIERPSPAPNHAPAEHRVEPRPQAQPQHAAPEVRPQQHQEPAQKHEPAKTSARINHRAPSQTAARTSHPSGHDGHNGRRPS